MLVGVQARALAELWPTAAPVARRLAWAAGERQLRALLLQLQEALAERRVRRQLAALAEQCLAAVNYDAAVVAHCEAVLRALGRPVAPDAGQVVQEYRAGRGCKLIAHASRLKRMKMCVRCMLRDKTVLGKQPTHMFLKAEHALSCPDCKNGVRTPVRTL